MNNCASKASGCQAATVILVVDADVVFREFESRTLADCGYTVLKASGREQALRLVHQTSSIHLLLTESPIHEPDADTFEFAHQFRRAHPAAPILLVLAGFERFDPRFNSLGQVGTMSKPFAPKELVNNVHRLIGEVAPIRGRQPQGTGAHAIA